MNKKGFTLVELLGVIIILSIIMLIAIPNVTSILQRSKKDTYIADAKKMVSITLAEISKGKVDKPATGEIRLVTLKDLATGDVVSDSDNNKYDEDKSFVEIVRKNGYLVYYVQLVATNSKNRTSGIILVNSEKLDTDEKYDCYSGNISSLPIASTSDPTVSSKLTSND